MKVKSSSSVLPSSESFQFAVRSNFAIGFTDHFPAIGPFDADGESRPENSRLICTVSNNRFCVISAFKGKRILICTDLFNLHLVGKSAFRAIELPLANKWVISRL